MNIDERLAYLEQVCVHATPGPWKNDCGNGQIESEHPQYRRAVVCDRAETFRYNPGAKHGNDPRYEMCPDAVRIDPEADMEFIAMAREAVPKLLAVARVATLLVYASKKCSASLYDHALNNELLRALEALEG